MVVLKTKRKISRSWYRGAEDSAGKMSRVRQQTHEELYGCMHIHTEMAIIVVCEIFNV